MKTWEAARGHWKQIFNHFNIDESHFTGKHTACPVCGGKDRFRYDNKEERGTWLCNACGAGNGITLLQKITGRSYREVADEIDGLLGVKHTSSGFAQPSYSYRINHFVRKTARRLDDINPARRYLKSRNLRPTSEVLYCPQINYYGEGGQIDGEFPAMVVPVVSPEGKLVSHHVTYLTPDGKKAPVQHPKKMLSALAPMSGSAIRLTRKIYSHIGIAEGVENALAVSQLYDIPCWACGTADLLASFTPPKGIYSIKIFGDQDKNFKGQRAIYTLANRLYGLYQIDVDESPVIGQDYADMVG